jgi:ElaB/YqjD/DUF883 family membrane-anchored ribosome-binding protein
MSQSVLDQMGEQIDEATHKASRAASAVADALEDGVGAARRAARHGGDVAAEFLCETKKRVQHYPVETVAVTFAAGVVAGAALGWMMRRRQY